MKYSGFVVLISMVCMIARAEQHPIPVYYHAVKMPAHLQNQYFGRFDTKILAADLATLLQQATGQRYVPLAHQGPASGKGIYLLLDPSFKTGTNETGIIEYDGKQKIMIRARYTTGISYALYSWLNELGFRFYLPGTNWNKVPALTSIFSKKAFKKIYTPAFKLRMFYASGGTYAVKGLDDDKQMLKDWQQWYQRNRMGSDYIGIDGHIGELFNITHRQEIEREPELLAPVNGKRQYATGGKIDPTNKKAVDMFSDWIVDEFKKNKEQWPSFLPIKKYVTADAGDGGNYCHTPACTSQFKSVPDQAFSIVNETARKIRKADARFGVSTLAYTERADTPSVRIEPNVHVMVVPTAFQTVSTATDLMQRWAKKSSNISMYDYLNIGVWAWDKPFFNMYDYHQNLLFLRKLKIDGIHYETSFSSMASGLQQYFILRFLAEPYVSVEKLLDEYCDDNFEEASGPVKRLFREWYFSSRHLKTNYDYPSFYEDELGRFIRYIMEAEKSKGISNDVTKRIDELKAYVIYLCQFYELFAELSSLETFSKNSALKKAKSAEILTFTWQQYPSRIFHNTQLNDLYKPLLDEHERPNWDYHKSRAFAAFNKPDAGIINQYFNRYKAKFLPVAQHGSDLTDDILNELSRYSADSIRIISMDEEAFKDFSYPVTFYASSAGKLRIRYKAGTPGIEGNSKVSIISVEKRDYSFIKTNTIKTGNSSGVLEFQIPSKGHYRLYLSQYRATPVEFIIYPNRNLFYHAKKSIMMNGFRMQEPQDKAAYPNRYLAIYVPMTDSLRYVQFSSLYYSSTNSSRFYLANGSPLPVHESGAERYYQTAPIPYPPKQPVIFYENSVYRWPPVLKNGPDAYFFLKFPLK